MRQRWKQALGVIAVTVEELRREYGYPDTGVYDKYGTLLMAVSGSCNYYAGDCSYDGETVVDFDFNEVDFSMYVIV